MNVFETFRTAWQSLRANMLRTLLSMLGIIIGVAAVVSVVSIGTGGQQLVMANISQLGSNLITVNPAAARGRQRAASAGGHADRYLRGISAPATYMSFAILHIW